VAIEKLHANSVYLDKLQEILNNLAQNGTREDLLLLASDIGELPLPKGRGLLGRG